MGDVTAADATAAKTDSETTSGQIVMFTTRWCGDCMRSKRVFKAMGVPYLEIDIEHDEKSMRFVERLNGGMHSVPTIVFPDGSWLVEPRPSVLEARLREFSAR